MRRSGLLYSEFKIGAAATGSLGQALEGNIATFFGQQLAALVVAPTTTAGAVLSSLGADLGGVYIGAAISGALNGAKFGAFAGAVGIVIGAFIGAVLGALFGDLFGHAKPRIPMATASVVLQLPKAQYALGATTVANYGNLQYVMQIATTAQQTLNGIINTVVGAKGMVANAVSPTQTYG